MPKSPEGWHCFHCGASGHTGGFCTQCGGGSRDFVARDTDHCRKCGLADVPSYANFCPRCGVSKPLSGEYAFAVHDAMSRANLSEADAAALILREGAAKAA